MITLTISGRRGAGRSTAMATLAVADPDALLIVLNDASKSYVLRYFPGLARRVITFHDFDYCRGRRFKRVYIDDYDHMFETSKLSMWTVLQPMRPELVVTAVEDHSFCPLPL